MPALILFAFIAIPIIEIALLIQVGGAIGIWPTLGAVVATAVFGTWMLRVQGISTLRRAQASLAHNQFPAAEVFNGLCLVFAGALLLTPGFVTDALGLLLMTPPLRALLRARITGWMLAHGRIHMTGMGGMGGGMEGGMGSSPDPDPARDPTVIDGEFEEIDPEAPPSLPIEPPKSRGSSPWFRPKRR